MYYKLARLISIPTKKPSTTAEVFISNPQIDQEAVLGKLFILCEIESNKAAALKIINFFISNLPSNYYQNEKISLKERMGTINVGEIFENALTKTNDEFQNFLKKERIKVSPKILNILVGVICKNDIFFSTVGKTKALLIYAEKLKEEIKEGQKKIYKIINVEEEERSIKVNLTKIFSHITEGKVPPEGYFLFTNEILPEYTSNKQLTKIITTLPPLSAVEQIKSQLYKINSYVTFLAILIKSSHQPERKKTLAKIPEYISVDSSLERMQATEQETAKYLSPVGTVESKSFFKRPWILLTKLFSPRLKSYHSKRDLRQIRDKILLERRSRVVFLRKIINSAKIFFIHLINIIAYFIKLLSRPKELIFKFKKALSKFKISILKILGWFLNLSTASKLLLITFVICSSLFAYSLYYLQITKTKEQEGENYEQLIKLIEQKQNQVEASLLYHNEEKANQLVKEIKKLMQQLTVYKYADQRLINKFEEKNNTQIEKLSHVVKINEPKELASFAHFNNNAEPLEMHLLDKKILSPDPKNSSIYQFNLEDSTISVLQDKIGNLNHGTKFDDFILFIADGKRLTVDKDSEVILSEQKIIDNLQDITAIYNYNNRLYILSANQNNILRYGRDYNTYVNWIKEDIGIRDAVSFAIDGYIYVLRNNGQITKFLSGYSQEFQLSEIIPPFQKATKIKVSQESEESDGYIYILEPVNKRLAVFDKKGKFILQYKIEKFDNLKDFIVLEEERKILFLDGTGVYEVEAQHLK